MLIGIAGPQGSGKTSVTDYIGASINFRVIHVDFLVHQVLDLNLYNEVLSWFNLPKEASIDRKKIGRKLFSSQELMERYNARIYKEVLIRLNELIANEENLIIDWNFLPITEIFDLCDLKILITAPLDERIRRVVKRDKIDESYAYEREKNGIKYDSKMFDLVLNNYNIKLEQLTMEVKKLICK